MRQPYISSAPAPTSKGHHRGVNCSHLPHVSCVQGEAEIKVFSALRTRNARYPGCRHAVVCCDGDAVVMALLLPPTVRLSIDFGACGVLQVADLRAAWATEGMRAAGVPPWPVVRPPPLERGGLEGLKRRARVGAEGGWEGFSAEQMDGVLRVRASG